MLAPDYALLTSNILQQSYFRAGKIITGMYYIVLRNYTKEYNYVKCVKV